MNWKEVYKLPLYCIEGCPPWVNSANGVHALDIIANTKLCIDLVDLLNGEDIKFNSSHEFSVIDTEIYCDGDVLMRIRGWGHLTGEGALNLPAKEAVTIQNEFAEYLLNKLKNATIKTSSTNKATEN